MDALYMIGGIKYLAHIGQTEPELFVSMLRVILPRTVNADVDVKHTFSEAVQAAEERVKVMHRKTEVDGDGKTKIIH